MLSGVELQKQPTLQSIGRGAIKPHSAGDRHSLAISNHAHIYRS